MVSDLMQQNYCLFPKQPYFLWVSNIWGSQLRPIISFSPLPGYNHPAIRPGVFSPKQCSLSAVVHCPAVGKRKAGVDTPAVKTTVCYGNSLPFTGLI